MSAGASSGGVRQAPKNKVQVEGAVVFDPSGKPGVVTNFVLAVPSGWKDNTSRINCVAWHNEHPDLPGCEKGTYLRVEGRLVGRSYDNKQGVKVNVLEVVCDSVVEVKHKSFAPGAAPQQRQAAPKPAPAAPAADEDDGIPF